MWDWEELDQSEEVTITITATAKDDKVITLSKTYKEIYAVTLVTGDGTSRKLQYLDKRQFDELYPEPEFHGRREPFTYTFWEEKLELFPVPDTADTLRVRGNKWPTAFNVSTTGATSDFDSKDDILIFLSVSTFYDMLGEYERATTLFNKARAKVEFAKDEQQNKPDLEIKPLSEAHRKIPIGQYWKDPFSKGSPR
jgi:hypothetical protein